MSGLRHEFLASGTWQQRPELGALERGCRDLWMLPYLPRSQQNQRLRCDCHLYSAERPVAALLVEDGCLHEIWTRLEQETEQLSAAIRAGLVDAQVGGFRFRSDDSMTLPFALHHSVAESPTCDATILTLGPPAVSRLREVDCAGESWRLDQVPGWSEGRAPGERLLLELPLRDETEVLLAELLRVGWRRALNWFCSQRRPA